MPRQSTESRFWKKVRKTKTCWLWLAAKNPKGYGYFGDPLTKRVKLAHRFSWELHNGRIPDGLNVLHRCDTPACIRPDHLFLGTGMDNYVDAVNKGRQTGLGLLKSQEKIRKFSDDEVRKIRKLYASERHFPRNKPHAYSLRGLAKLFNVEYATISQIVKRRTYKHVS